MQTNVCGTKLVAQLAKMYAIAAIAHAGQFDKSGKPYFEHCLAVKNLLNTDDLELQMIALGHDLIEDTEVSAGRLILEGFSKRVVHAIVCMTKHEGQTEEEYKLAVKSNLDSVRVKKADLTHNSDLRRLKCLRQKDFDRTVKYQKFYAELCEVEENWGKQQTVVQ